MVKTVACGAADVVDGVRRAVGGGVGVGVAAGDGEPAALLRHDRAGGRVAVAPVDRGRVVGERPAGVGVGERGEPLIGQRGPAHRVDRHAGDRERSIGDCRAAVGRDVPFARVERDGDREAALLGVGARAGDVVRVRAGVCDRPRRRRLAVAPVDRRPAGDAPVERTKCATVPAKPLPSTAFLNGTPEVPGLDAADAAWLAPRHVAAAISRAARIDCRMARRYPTSLRRSATEAWTGVASAGAPAGLKLTVRVTAGVRVR